MFTTIAFALAIGTSAARDCSVDFHNLPPKVAAIVSAAWQERAQAEKPLTKLEQRHQADLKSDAEIGKKYSELADKEFKATENKEYLERVTRIGNEMAAIANASKVDVLWGDKRLNPFQYTFKVIQDKHVNAFSLPGGYVYVNEGLVKYVESDDELAGVMAHEIAHASFRHLATLERERSKLDAWTLPLILVSIVAGGQHADTGSALLTLNSLVTQAKTSGWGQDAERSADFGAFQYILKSKYNPVGLLTFLEKLGRDQRAIEAIDWGIYRTHPPSKERATRLENYLTKASLPIHRSAVATSFRVAIKPADNGAVEMSFNGRPLFFLGGDAALKRAQQLEPQLNHFFDSVPELYDLKVGQAEILWRARPLVEFTKDDAVVSGKPLEETTSSALKALKRELYLLAYRIWDAR